APVVKVTSGTDFTTVLQSFMPYSAKFLGGVSVAAGNVAVAGRVDIITVPGKGMAPEIRFFNGGNLSSPVQRPMYAYDATFLGGVTVAAKDIDGDGKADLIFGTGAGGGAHVRIVRGQTGAELRSQFAFDPAFLGGIYVG